MSVCCGYVATFYCCVMVVCNSSMQLVAHVRKYFAMKIVCSPEFQSCGHKCPPNGNSQLFYFCLFPNRLLAKEIAAQKGMH